MRKLIVSCSFVSIVCLTLVAATASATKIVMFDDVAQKKADGSSYSLPEATVFFGADENMGHQVVGVTVRNYPEIRKISREEFAGGRFKIVDGSELLPGSTYQVYGKLENELRLETHPPNGTPRVFEPGQKVLVDTQTGIPVMLMDCLNPIITSARWHQPVAPPATIAATCPPGTTQVDDGDGNSLTIACERTTPSVVTLTTPPLVVPPPPTIIPLHCGDGLLAVDTNGDGMVDTCELREQPRRVADNRPSVPDCPDGLFRADLDGDGWAESCIQQDNRRVVYKEARKVPLWVGGSGDRITSTSDNSYREASYSRYSPYTVTGNGVTYEAPRTNTTVVDDHSWRYDPTTVYSPTWLSGYGSRGGLWWDGNRCYTSPCQNCTPCGNTCPTDGPVRTDSGQYPTGGPVYTNNVGGPAYTNSGQQGQWAYPSQLMRPNSLVNTVGGPAR